LIDSKNDKSEILFRFDIERLNTLNRISEWFIDKEFPKMVNEKKPQSDPNEILTVEEVALMLKLTPQTIYKLIKKGKIQKVEISTIDKPGIIPKIRVRRGEVERWLDGR
jgi:excisionase family DNA binding protein